MKQFMFGFCLLLAVCSNIQAQSFEFNALRFNTPSDFVSTPWNPDFGASQDFSLEFSLRSNGWSGDPAIISDKDWNSGKNPGFNVALADNGKSIDVNVADGVNRADLEAGTVNDGKWHHILVAFDRDGDVVLSVDGQELQRTSIAGIGNIDSPFDFKIGQDGSGLYGFGGGFDIVNLRIWNLALNIEDLKGYTCGAVDLGFPYIFNLVHYWPMQEGGGTALNDELTAQVAAFSGGPVWTSGNIPTLAVNFDYSIAASVVSFNNLSTDATWYRWDFGDGASSTLPAPSHTYLNSGNFTVQLIAGNPCGQDTIQKNVLIANVGPLTGFNAARLCSSNRLDFIQTTYDPAFDSSKDFTIEFRMRSNGWDGDPAIVSDKDWDSGKNAGFVLALDNGSIKVNIGDGINRADISGSKPVDDGEWHHVLAAFDRDGVAALYLDGVLEGTRSLAAVGNVDSPFGLNIGQDGTGNYAAAYSVGGAQAEIAELRIWNRVINPQETLVCDTLSAAHPLWNDLLHYWKLNEGIGIVAKDSKAGADGSFQNTAAWSLLNLLPPAGAQFSFNSIQSTVEFVNLSTEGNYFWEFGDGSSSIEKNPAHTYLQTGTYTVRLIVNAACDSDTLERQVQITELSANLLSALELDGQTHYVSLQNDLNFGTSEDFTLELFVKTPGWSSDPAIFSNKDWDAGKNPGFVIAGKTDGAKWKFNIGDGVNRIDIDGGTINDNQWHHLAVSFDRDGQKILYQDGLPVASSAVVFTGNIDNALGLAIGQDGTFNYGAFFKGQVAEVRVWKQALDAATLAANICEAGPSHPYFSSLLHYWKADEGQGTAVNDSKGNNTGVYNGGWGSSINTIGDCGNQIPLNETGAGNAIDFDGFDDFMQVPFDSLLLVETAITVEAWVKARSLDQWESFVSFAQDNGSNESGFDFSYVDGKLRFRLTTENMGGNDWNDNPGYDIPLNEWVHVAGTYDGAVIRMYVNGQLVAQENKTGAIDWEFLPLEMRIGAYVDDNELYYWDGAVDELRIWNTARTTEQIRETMCRRLSGDEIQLLAYYRMDERSGIVVKDRSANQFDGSMENMVPAQDRIISGAGIGDTSVWVYGADLSAQTLELDFVAQGRLNLSGFSADAQGIQLYRVDAAPLNSQSLELLSNAGVYFGVVPAQLSKVQYNASWNYTGNLAAEALENDLFLAVRKDGEGLVWTNSLATLNSGDNNLTRTQLSARRELILAVEGANACPYPTAIEQSATTFSTITINWAGAASANVQYGPAGFTLGLGQNGVGTNNAFTLEGLEEDATYEVYVQADCGANGQSSWIGPFAFNTASCLPPAAPTVSPISPNAVEFSWSASSNASAYTIEWGPAGFMQGLGIQIQNISGNSYVLNGLPTNTNFSFYIRGNCGTAGESGWSGPFSFMTSGLKDLSDASIAVNVFPNPIETQLYLSVNAEQAEQLMLSLSDVTGRVLRREAMDVHAGNQVLGLDMTAQPAGIYMLVLRKGDLIKTIRVVKQ